MPDKATDASVPKTRRGRPVKQFDPETVEAILRQAKLGVPQRLIAQGLHVTPSCFSNWLERFAGFRESYQSARLEGVEARLRAIRDSVSGGKDGSHDWKADAWLLSRMFPEEFANPEKIALAVHNHSTTNVNVTVTTESLRAIQARRASALEGLHGRN